MKRKFLLCAAALMLLAGVAAAQSLADVARQTRKQNAKKPAPKVFTNDNLPLNAPISVTGQPPAPDQESAPSSNGGDQATTPDKAGKDAKADADKKTYAEKRDAAMKEWKQKFADQKQQIALLEREINVMQGEYRLRAAAYYADAGNALRNQAEWAKEDRDYRTRLDAKQKQLDQAKQKLDDMQEAARKAGMPSSVSD